MNIPELSRWTPFTFFFPGQYIEKSPYWRQFPFYDWSNEDYQWELDDWNGFKDTAQRPRETVETNRGDCEDYGLAAASWAISNRHNEVRLGFCWESGKMHPTHAICYDREAVYSSGEIFHGDVEDWLGDSAYKLILGRLVK